MVKVVFRYKNHEMTIDLCCFFFQRYHGCALSSFSVLNFSIHNVHSIHGNIQFRETRAVVHVPLILPPIKSHRHPSVRFVGLRHPPSYSILSVARSDNSQKDRVLWWVAGWKGTLRCHGRRKKVIEERKK